MIPFIDLQRQHAALREELLAATARVIDSSQFVLGAEGRALEQEAGEKVSPKLLPFVIVDATAPEMSGHLRRTWLVAPRCCKSSYGEQSKRVLRTLIGPLSSTGGARCRTLPILTERTR